MGNSTVSGSKSSRTKRTARSETEPRGSGKRREKPDVSLPAIGGEGFKALCELSASMTAEHNLDECLSLLLKRARALLATDTAFIALGDLPAGDAYISVTSGIKTKPFEHLRLPFRKALKNKVTRDGKICSVEDFAQEIEKQYHAVAADEGLVSGILAPLQIDGVNIGMLCVFNRYHCSFPQSALDTLSLLANLAAVEINRKQAQEELAKIRDALTRGERERILDLTVTNEKLTQEISDRRDAENALRIEKERLQGLSEQAPFGMVMISNRGAFEYINPKFMEIFGYNLSDIPDTNEWFRKAYPDRKRRDEVISCWTKDLHDSAPGDETSRIFIVTCKDGSNKIVNFRSVLLDAGETIMTCVDITEQETIGEALRKSKEKFESLFASMLDAFAYHKVILDDNGEPVDYVFLDVNDAFLRMMRLKRKQIIGKRVTEIMPGIRDSTFDWIAAYGKVALTGEDTKFEQYLEPLKKWHSISAYSPKKGHFVTIIDDITDRKLAEEKIERQSRFLENVFDSLTHPFYVVDAADYTIRMANAAAGALSLGVTCYNLFHNRDSACGISDYLCPLMEIKKSKKPVTVEHVHHDKSGASRFVEVHGYPLFDQNGDITQIIQYYLDITERKKTEQLLLESERLKAVGELASGVAHNFNNLLQIVVGKAQVASVQLESNLISKAQETIGKIIESLHLGAQTVKRLQDFARSGSQTATSNRTVFDLSDTVRQAIDMSSQWWKIEPRKKGVHIVLTRGVNPGCFIEADSNDLFEVAVNLIKNAVEALPSGGRITVATSVKNGEVVLEVKDTGVGISPENRGKVFQPFWTTKGGKGTGMGLASSYGIVKSYNGDISIDSSPGEGSCFTIRFPLFRKPAQESERVPKRPKDREFSILLIDDTREVLTALQDGLSAYAESVATALCGRDGIEIFMNRHIDVVVCDLVMSEMDGWEVARSIQSICSDRKTMRPLFILLTGHGHLSEDRGEMSDCGVDRILEKPIEPSQLMSIVREEWSHIDSRRREEPAP